MASNQQIHKTSYYQLPCGLFLEDFIDYKELDFKWGSAVKYEYRAGNKDGESTEKDHKKCGHYICEIAARENISCDEAYSQVVKYVEEAKLWDPPQSVRDWYKEYLTDWEPDNAR